MREAVLPPRSVRPADSLGALRPPLRSGLAGVVERLGLAALVGIAGPVPVFAQACADWTPTRQPFFGDVHVHTALSFDAYTFETRNGPRDAYRFAKGETVGLPPLDANGDPTRSHTLRAPLDFAAVTDHAEMLGETRLCTVGNLQTPACQAIRDGNFALVGFYFGAQFTEADPQRRAFCGTDGQLCLQAAADGVGIAMVQQAYVVDDLVSGRVVIPIPHVLRTGLGYFLACDARRANDYPLLQFREWARQTSIEQRARAEETLRAWIPAPH